MERTLFGTDGLRGRANQYPMTPDVCLALGRAVVGHFTARTPYGGGRVRPLVVMGRDTRISGPLFERALAAGIMSRGADVCTLGVIPTPAVARLTIEEKACAGLVISASHNPYEDNGVKVFGPDGFKLSDELELEIERMTMAFYDSEDPVPSSREIGRAEEMTDSVGRHIALVRRTLPDDIEFGGLNLVLDCAHGAAYEVAPRLFEELGARVTATGIEPDGYNINERRGALHPDWTSALVQKHGADLGIALDGDADRVILVDEQGHCINGDDILAICAHSLKRRGKLAKDTVVATLMSNLGLEVGLRALGIQLIRTKVGDRYVAEEMRGGGYNLGGENSGHVIFLDRATTGDGLMASLLVAEEMIRTDRPLSELRQIIRHYPQTTISVNVPAKPPLDELDSVQSTIRSARNSLGDTGRIVVRYSGTESKARVMVEGKHPDQVERWAHEIAEALNRAVKASD